MSDPDYVALLTQIESIDMVSLIDQYPTIDQSAQVLVILRQARRALAEAETQLEAFLCDVLPGGESVVDGIGTLRARWGASRVKWDHEGLRPVVVSAIADRLGVIVGAVDSVVNEWLTAASPSWKVSGLRAMEVDPDEYSTRRPGIPHVEIA